MAMSDPNTKDKFFKQVSRHDQKQVEGCQPRKSHKVCFVSVFFDDFVRYFDQHPCISRVPNSSHMGQMSDLTRWLLCP